MLHSCFYNGKFLKFYSGESLSSKNFFTVIVGKNGTGKSRLLKAIIERFVESSSIDSEARSAAHFSEKREDLQLRFDSFPQNIIAVSTSPFDRFPLMRTNVREEGYEYLGLRGLGNQNLSLSFMARIFGALLRSVMENRAQAYTIASVLNYLGYEGEIEARFVSEIKTTSIQEILRGPVPIAMDVAWNNKRSTPFMDKLRKASFAPDFQSSYLWYALSTWVEENKKPRVDVIINSYGAFDGFGKPLPDYVRYLFEYGFFKLRDVGLQKKKMPRKILIGDASSGEQCVVMALLGIASHIRDGAWIFIDEPEVCLHPEWQEKYIELLTDAFKGFSNCHFLIATHSPQIVSKLDDDNCFVLDLEFGTTVPASKLNKRSADFQLANLFRAPGYKNEYLTRELVNALEVIGAGDSLSSDRRKEIYQLLALKDFLEETDPVRKLMEILERSMRALSAI
jgi:predicted ATPase